MCGVMLVVGFGIFGSCRCYVLKVIIVDSN